LDEMKVASWVLSLIDGRDERTFSNTCCDTTIGRGEQRSSIDDLVRALFVAGRGPLSSQAVDPAGANLASLGHFTGDRQTFDSMRAQIEAALARGGWVIYMFHGVGEGDHQLFVDAHEHAKLIA